MFVTVNVNNHHQFRSTKSSTKTCTSRGTLSGRAGSTGSSARTEMDLLFSVDRCAGAEEPTGPEDCVMMIGRF